VETPGGFFFGGDVIFTREVRGVSAFDL